MRTVLSGLFSVQNDSGEVENVVIERMCSLINVDVEKIDCLHSSVFGIVLPTGDHLGREQFIGAIINGYIKYSLWKPQAIKVAINSGVATATYQSNMKIRVGGYNLPLSSCWHTEMFAWEHNRWCVTWSQSTAFR